MQGETQYQSLGGLFSRLSEDASTLLRDELALAKLEMSSKAAEGGSYAGLIGVGGATAFAGFLALEAAVIFGLMEAGLAAWLSSLIVGAVVAGGGLLMMALGYFALRSMDIAPRRTLDTLKGDGRWAAEHLR